MLRAVVLLFFLMAAPALAQSREGFGPGPVLPDVGPIAPVQSDLALPKGTKFKIAFDLHTRAEADKLSRQIETAARTLNMHVAAGVPKEDVQIVLIAHGPAAQDLLNPESYAKRTDGKANNSLDAVKKLLGAGVEIYLCGQTAASQKISKADLIPGVKMSLSAITAHAIYQQRGYTLNPF
ncbi:DsrE family protein [Sandarakinorhabdus sp.]|uniref:DsrE family protein n=1 Tax=Sandarakinorhabdus sp. TaxID=1916663 RepID=UPI00286E91FA|nr:DsrE family protein [Sandarakinorhabdus sp.]